MIVPSFNRWRARLIAHTASDAMGPMDSISFCPVAPTVALVCPFERFDGDPCEQLITYYLRTDVHALGACHRHLAHAMDILVAADGSSLSDPSDDDLLAPSAAAEPRRAPLSEEDAELAQWLEYSGLCTSADFGTTVIHEGYGLVAGAQIVLAGDAVRDQRCADLVDVADDYGIHIVPQDDGSLRLTTSMPDLSEEWICQNCALREMMRDALLETLDHTGYRYRAIADAVPEAAGIEPRVFTTRGTGRHAIKVDFLATALEHPLQRVARSADRRTGMLYADRAPRPGDYVELAFARYRVVTVQGTDDANLTVAAVLDRIHRPSRN